MPGPSARSPARQPCRHGVARQLLATGGGDSEAFARLFDLFYPAIRASAGSEDDVVAAFVRLWRVAPTYRGGRDAVNWILWTIEADDQPAPQDV